MATKQNEKPTNAVATSVPDMLDAFVAEAPEVQKRDVKRADFIPNPDILAKVTASLTGIGAIAGSKGYGSDKEAKAASKIWKQYALHAVESIEGKTIAFRIVARDNLFFWKFQLATKRVPKEEATAPAQS